MQPDFKGISFLVGNGDVLRNVEKIAALPIFSDCVLMFLDDLSKKLLKNKEAKNFPDLIAFAFWIRKASILPLADLYEDGKKRIGRGLAFHITPSNIPVQFAVSLVYALIAGNASIVRVSDKQFSQTDIICRVIKQLLDSEYKNLKDYICIIRYPHNEEITSFFSRICDVRLIWGGDETINAVRNSRVSPRCIDLGFAERYSLCIIDSDAYMEMNADSIAENFYNDTFFNDQNACSSPSLVVWTGNSISKAKKLFWSALERIVKKKYDLDPIMSSEKLLKTIVCASQYPEIRQIKNDNYIVRIELPSIHDDIMDFRGNCGYFFEYETSNLEDLIPLFGKKCQTIVYLGDLEEQLSGIIVNNGVKGVDRIVPVGRAAHISFIWDGLDLPDILSRRISNI